MLNVLSLNRMNLFSEHCESHTDCKYGEICDSTHKFCKASKYYTDSQIICPPLIQLYIPYNYLFLFFVSFLQKLNTDHLLYVVYVLSMLAPETLPTNIVNAPKCLPGFARPCAILTKIARVM